MRLVRQLRAKPMMLRIGFVAEQRHGLVDVADDQIGTTIVVQVANSEAAADVRGLKVMPSPRVHADEPIAVDSLVAHEDRQLTHTCSHRMAVHMAIRNDDVQPTVAVNVEESSAKADVGPADASQTGTRAAELEQSATADQNVAVQGVQLVLEIRNQQRRPAAAAVVAGIDPHAAVDLAALIPCGPQLCRLVLEAQLAGRAAIYVEEFVGRIVGDIDVRLAIAVEVHDDNAQSLAEIALSICLA